ncbi:MAG: DUF2815 family protein [Solobacterium sp.]|nr:DUF2815 family protein [Solobacterium sp.]
MAKPIVTIIGPVTLWYQHLIQPAESMNGQMKFSTMALLPKTDKQSLDKLSAAYAECAAARWGTKRPAGIRKPLRDGSEKEDVGPEYYFLNTSSNRKPKLYGMDRRELTDTSKIHSGNKGYLVLSPYAYDNSGNRGVSFGLSGFILTEEGENLESVDTDEIFEGLPVQQQEQQDGIPLDDVLSITDEEVPF